VEKSLTRFIREGDESPLSRRFLEAEKAMLGAEIRWKEPQGSFSSKHAAKDSLRADFGRTSPFG
jgi:hypothetical protein